MPQHNPEFDLIDWIRRRVGADPRLGLGIGDDAAVLRFPEPTDCLVAVDMLMEGVHFTLPEAGPEQVGRKALGVNLSDIAAMAGRPLAAVTAVALPKNRSTDLGQKVHDGLQQLAEQFHIAVAGGDTNIWDGPLVISVTLLGETTGTGPVRRDGAQPGDWIFVTGELGGSLAGKHLSFQPRVEEALQLHKAVTLHAMIDISDGLAADLHHILEESRVGAVLQADAVPVTEAAHSMGDGKSPLEHALQDGEDFELLFTVRPEDGRRLLENPPVTVPLSKIGEITSGRTCEIIDADGVRHPLPPRGWQHGVSR